MKQKLKAKLQTKRMKRHQNLQLCADSALSILFKPLIDIIDILILYLLYYVLKYLEFIFI